MTYSCKKLVQCHKKPGRKFYCIYKQFGENIKIQCISFYSQEGSLNSVYWEEGEGGGLKQKLTITCLLIKIKNSKHKASKPAVRRGPSRKQVTWNVVYLLINIPLGSPYNHTTLIVLVVCTIYITAGKGRLHSLNRLQKVNKNISPTRPPPQAAFAPKDTFVARQIINCRCASLVRSHQTIKIDNDKKSSKVGSLCWP